MPALKYMGNKCFLHHKECFNCSIKYKFCNVCFTEQLKHSLWSIKALLARLRSIMVQNLPINLFGISFCFLAHYSQSYAHSTITCILQIMLIIFTHYINNNNKFIDVNTILEIQALG